MFLSTALSSFAVIFFLIRVRGPFPGGADIGFGLILLFSPFFSWPLALVGWFIGGKISSPKAYVIGVLALIIYVSLSISYVQLMKREAARLEQINLSPKMKAP
ncbi:MAG: hypothetical protein K2Q18_15480 [Bdellovibrionales bacterium]|nr:hypothetical protein [Bdellovibrionales bacterium]